MSQRPPGRVPACLKNVSTNNVCFMSGQHLLAEILDSRDESQNSRSEAVRQVVYTNNIIKSK